MSNFTKLLALMVFMIPLTHCKKEKEEEEEEEEGKIK